MGLLSTILLLMFMFMVLVIWYVWNQGIISIEVATVLWGLSILIIYAIAYFIDRMRNR